LADPAPIIHELLGHPTILHHYRLAGVVTCVDGIFGAEQLERQAEALKQAAVADRLLISKADLASTEQLAELDDRLRQLNPAAEIHHLVKGQADPQLILDMVKFDPLSKNPDVQQWLKAESYRQVRVKPGYRLSKNTKSMTEDINRHGGNIRAFCFTFDQPLPPDGLITALEMLTTLYGDQLLRIKGIVDIGGDDKPRVIHGVQRMFFPLTTLEHWPDDQRGSRLVFIVRDMDSEFIAQTLDHFIEAAKTCNLRVATN
jgi:G3E family GTPase